MMRNSDRGNMKGTSLMIPEHKEMLQELYAELDQVEKPELDEQEKERINESLADSPVIHRRRRKLPY